MADDLRQAETDSRFPSGEWVGFFLQPSVSAGRRRMELALAFCEGSFSGEGCDHVGEFLIKGRYDVHSGDVTFHKHYVGRHGIYYRGCNEGKGIWGVWELGSDRGGFHIWPKGMADPTQDRLEAEAELPNQVEERVLVGVEPTP